MRTALTIAGSDSGAGAGIQADLKTFAAFGLYGVCAITAVTAQNTLGVAAVAPLTTGLVTAQVETVAADITLHATKIGMLATAAIVEAVAAAIEELELPFVVVDPIMVSSSGERLLDDDGVRMLIAELLPRAYLVTPNIPEAEALSGCRIRSSDEAKKAAARILDMGAASVVITGGHGPGAEVIDLLYDGHVFHELRTERIAAGPTHGTGCTFASAVAAGLALGHPLAESARRAQAYVAGALAHAPAVGRGRHPLDHFWQTRESRDVY